MKKAILIVLAVVVLLVIGILYFFKSDEKNPYGDVQWGRFNGQCESSEIPNGDFGKDYAQCDHTVPKVEIPTFTALSFPFTNKFDNTKSLPMMAGAMIDVDNDGIDEIFVGGGVTQQDALFKYSENGFVDISNTFTIPKKPAGKTTFGASSFDLDNDGMTDLLLTGDYGLFWYRNTGSGFEAKNLNAPLNEKSSATTTTIGDFNKDGHPDIFVAAYLYKEKMEGQTIFKDFNYGASSLLLQNNGDNTFTDVTKSVGLEYVHNTFQGMFVDVNNDGWLDLVVVYDTGEARIYKNVDGKKYQAMPNPLTGKYAYPMGIAVGDFNNDGLVDFFFSNTGSSVPIFLARGDLAKGDVLNEKWILFENKGNFVFEDVAEKTKIADFEFSWGAIFEDFNLDGRQDLVVAENYVDFPPHKIFKLPCRFLIQREDGTFAAVEDQAGVVNKNFAITPIKSDFNEDGYPDFIYINLDGTVTAFINNGGNSNYLAFRFPENNQNYGAQVTIQIDENNLLSDVYVIGEGLGSDQSAVLTFGLGNKTVVSKAIIKFIDGTEQVIDNPKVNQTLKILKR